MLISIGPDTDHTHGSVYIVTLVSEKRFLLFSAGSIARRLRRLVNFILSQLKGKSFLAIWPLSLLCTVWWLSYCPKLLKRTLTEFYMWCFSVIASLSTTLHLNYSTQLCFYQVQLLPLDCAFLSANYSVIVSGYKETFHSWMQEQVLALSPLSLAKTWENSEMWKEV